MWGRMERGSRCGVGWRRKPDLSVVDVSMDFMVAPLESLKDAEWGSRWSSLRTWNVALGVE